MVPVVRTLPPVTLPVVDTFERIKDPTFNVPAVIPPVILALGAYIVFCEVTDPTVIKLPPVIFPVAFTTPVVRKLPLCTLAVVITVTAVRTLARRVAPETVPTVEKLPPVIVPDALIDPTGIEESTPVALITKLFAESLTLDILKSSLYNTYRDILILNQRIIVAVLITHYNGKRNQKPQRNLLYPCHIT